MDYNWYFIESLRRKENIFGPNTIKLITINIDQKNYLIVYL